MRLAAIVLALVLPGCELLFGGVAPDTFEGSYDFTVTKDGAPVLVYCGSGDPVPFTGTLAIFRGEGRDVFGRWVACSQARDVKGLTYDGDRRIALALAVDDPEPLLLEDALLTPGAITGSLSGHGLDHAVFSATKPGARHGKVPYDPPNGSPP